MAAYIPRQVKIGAWDKSPNYVHFSVSMTYLDRSDIYYTLPSLLAYNCHKNQEDTQSFTPLLFTPDNWSTVCGYLHPLITTQQTTILHPI